MVNPFIYGIFRPEFRQTYKLIFRKIVLQTSAYGVSFSGTNEDITSDANSKEEDSVHKKTNLAVKYFVRPVPCALIDSMVVLKVDFIKDECFADERCRSVEVCPLPNPVFR